MWTFRQSDGGLLHNGAVIATGYSGYGAHANQPADETLKNLGPIPTGTYAIAPMQDEDGGPHGPYVLPLVPHAENEMHGRDGFLMHGDNAEGNHTASHGCIILPRATRVLIDQSGDRALEVVA